MVSRVLKGWHFSIPHPLSLHYGKEEETKEVTFDASCLYEPLDSEHDYNKLFGWSFGFHHRNSVRVGWRSQGNQIELILYVYEDGKRCDTDIPGILCDIGKKYRVTLRRIKDEYWLSVVDTESLLYRFQWRPCSKTIKPTWGYKLGLYFGGQKPAPHTIKVTMT